MGNQKRSRGNQRSKNKNKTSKKKEAEASSSKPKQGKGDQATQAAPRTVYFYRPQVMPYGTFCQWNQSPISIPTTSLEWLVAQAPRPGPAPTEAREILASYPSPITFSCAEQAYMFLKALYFHSELFCTSIMEARYPSQHKQLGRGVPGYDDAAWCLVRERVARVVNYCKFMDAENARMRAVLLGTGDAELVEAGRRDRVWGIGFYEWEAERERANWGLNLLGKALMSVRERIRWWEESGGSGVGEWDGDLGYEDEDEDEGEDGGRGEGEE
ncbi:hypothetical protein ACJQWK_09587 [Exserohilum turcicum]